MNQTVSIVIPAYNEAGTIASAIEETIAVFKRLETPFEIIVVDDGSSDETASAVQAFGPAVRLIRHETNLGKGAAVRTGALAAEGAKILFFDADLSTHPGHAENILPLLDTHDIAIGSREMAGSIVVVPQSWRRRLAGRLFSRLVKAWFGLPFEDTQCGFKAFRAGVRPMFDALETRGWTFDVELLARAARNGHSIAEMPVIWQDHRESRVRFGHAWGIWKELRAAKRLL